MIDFTGTGKRLSAVGYAAAAKDAGCDVAAIKAVVEVEARGRGFDTDNRPKALFEPHKFYKHLGAGKKRDLAVAKKLAYPKWKPGNYPSSSDGVYAQIIAACAIDEDAALMATSWGLGQVLGEYYDEAGYPTPQDFVRAMCQGEDAQLAIMVNLMQVWNLDDELQRLDWKGFARGWNGPGYAANRYDEKLAKAYAAAGGTKAEKPLGYSVAAKMGDKGDVVNNVQNLLTRAGFPVRPDGDFGEETKRQVRLFQLDRGLKADGIVGPKTLEALTKAPAFKQVEHREEATIEEVKAVSVIAKDAGRLKTFSGFGAAAMGALGVSEQAGLLTNMQAVGAAAQQAGGVAGQVQGFLGAVVPLVTAYWWIVAVAVLLAAAYYGHTILQQRVADHRSGKTV